MKWLPLITLTLVPGCAVLGSGSQTNYSETNLQVMNLLDQHKFAEARALIQGRGAMCKGYNSSGACYAGVYEEAESELTTKITFAEKCDAAISSAEQSRPGSIVEANGIKIRLHQACTPPEFPDSWIPTMPDSYKSRIEAADSRLGADLARASAAKNPITEAANRCRAGMRWGYMAQGKPGKTVQAIAPGGYAIKVPTGNGSAPWLKGEFAEGDKCEEARLTDPQAVPDGTFLLNRCKARYVGQQIEVGVVKIEVMGGKPSEFGTKNTSYFSTTEKCEHARANGYENQVDSSLAEEFRKIGAAGTNARPRFIGECQAFQQVVCKIGSEEPHPVFLLE